MNRTHFSLFFLSLLILAGCKQSSDNEGEALVALRYEQNETVTYDEAVRFYQLLDNHYSEAKLLTYGKTDVGKPLHLFVMDSDKHFTPESAKQTNKRIVLINNGIHPGEPEGIDASLMFADDILRNKDGMRRLLDNTIICIIPVYNIGGMLNRSAYHRTGQTTPKEAGHRGNAKNLDLNRDFVKMDTKNAKAFAEIFRLWQPDVFLDTHTTNGTDHPQVITLIPFQTDALPEPLATFYHDSLITYLYAQMANAGFDMIPYVDYWNTTPKDGIKLNPQTPRYSTGYTGLFNSMSFMTENQIYANYPDRVHSVYHFKKALVTFTNEHSDRIGKLRKEADEFTSKQKEFVLQWDVDSTRFRMIRYKGYEGETGISPVTGLPRFGFNREKPYDTIIPYYERHIPVKTVKAPEYYILPQAWEEVVERLSINRTDMKRFTKDTSVTVQRYIIKEVKTSPYKYNWHRNHTHVELDIATEKVVVREGDYLIPVNQPANKYIVEMLEPEGQDSFFRWNFFDPILEEREYYSSFGFEENALRYLNEHPDFRKEWEEAIKNDTSLAGNHRAQLGYIYQHTEWADNVTKKYPVLRIEEKIQLPVK
ncbi:MAG TPA: M14 family zinc carboxypeptidase [Bacteroidales bacterium]|nr:M14 family zinc carboxypeptidase [Bacteroidales bacterium]HPR57840.1 M14 family zinc carboxypeptidase [Bacteroidales bacterium]